MYLDQGQVRADFGSESQEFRRVERSVQLSGGGKIGEKGRLCVLGNEKDILWLKIENFDVEFKWKKVGKEIFFIHYPPPLVHRPVKYHRGVASRIGLM